MIGNIIKLDFRKAAPEAEKALASGRFRSEAEARAWWAKHDAENPFEVILRERFRAHREMIERPAAQLGEPPPSRPPHFIATRAYVQKALDATRPAPGSRRNTLTTLGWALRYFLGG